MKKNTLSFSIQSIRARNNEVLSKMGKVINPHSIIWRKNSKDQNASTPIVFFNEKEEAAQLEVVLEIEGAQNGAYQLKASTGSGEVLFLGETTLSGKRSSPISCTLDCCQRFEDFTFLEEGLLHWEWNALKGKRKSEKEVTPLQLYWIKKTEPTSPFLRKGIPIELLPQLAKFHSQTILNPANYNPIEPITKVVFNFQPPRYDIYNGAPHFVTINGWNNITLNYTAYIKAHSVSSSILNCYDAAAVLQYTLSFNGYNYPSVQYCFMAPFGYLKLTNLIGRGNCNNPFYGSSGGPAVINVYAITRTAFGNHAFCYYQPHNAIADSCAGPHVGNETPPQYVASATDSQYHNPPVIPRGTAANIGYYRGVTQVNVVGSYRQLAKSALPHLKDFLKTTQFKKKALAKTEPKYVVGHWPSPERYPVFQNENWEISHEEVLPGLEEGSKIWHLHKGEVSVFVKLHLASAGNELAYNRFVAIGSLSEASELPYENGPEDLGHYSAMAIYPESQRYFWVFHNAVLEITSLHTEHDLLPLARWYFEWAKRHLRDSLEPYLPQLELLHSNTNPKAGELFTIMNTSEGDHQLEYLAEDYSQLRLVAENKNTLTFEALKPSRNTFQLMLVDRETLLLSTREIELIIED